LKSKNQIETFNLQTGIGFIFLMLLMIISLAVIIFTDVSKTSWVILGSGYIGIGFLVWLSLRWHGDLKGQGHFLQVISFLVIIAVGPISTFSSMITPLFRKSKKTSISRIKTPRRNFSKKNNIENPNLQIGDTVTFHPKDQDPVIGLIAQFNKKTVKVVSNTPGIYWNITPNLLTKVKPPTPSANSKRTPALQLVKS
jgi:hypothetical protein